VFEFYCLSNFGHTTFVVTEKNIHDLHVTQITEDFCATSISYVNQGDHEGRFGIRRIH
jgi:hypothetical protein